MNFKFETWRLTTIVICVALLMGGGADALFRMESLGYTSGYEGVRASFVGIEYNTRGKRESSGKADLIGNSLYFDADNPDRYAPNLVGEMTNAFVPEKSVRPSWVFPELWKDTQYIKNPIDTYEWNLPNPDDPDETIAYIMEEWLLRMYVSITAEWDKSSSAYSNVWEKSGNTRYRNTKIWIELDISPIWYFEGADQVYFGLGKVVTSDVAFGVLGKTDDDYSPTGKFSVTPESRTTYRYLYYSKYGTTQFTPTNPKTYQGRILNPKIFGDKMYFHIDLNNFGTDRWGNPFTGYNSKGDAVTWGFDVHVFVVGEWKVQDIEEIPDVYGREPMEQYGWGYYFGRMLADPRTQFWLIVGAIALIFLFLAIFAPSVLIVIFSLLTVWTSRSKRKKG